METKFITLEEFLAMQPTSGVVMHKEAQSWLRHYKTAKASWERFPNGLPIGTMVRTLRPGFGGGEGIRRFVKRIHTDPSGTYYILAETMTSDRESLCETNSWWNLVEPIVFL